MERDQIRLECIKLAVARTTDHTDCTTRAEDYFEFITKPEGTRSETVGVKSQKPAITPKSHGAAVTSGTGR